MENRIVTWARMGIVVTLISSALSKSLNVSEVEATFYSSGLFPKNLAEEASMLLLLGEWIVTLLLLVGGRALAYGFGFASLLSSCFVGFSVWRWWQDLKAPCSCFGLLLRLDPWQSALLSLTMCFAALYSLLWMDMANKSSISRRSGAVV